ncbi:PilZ domain-containing protein [Alteromonadaceae bacterium M269]|nr:PilZ domain-containing protein [Alteromonadaceae bacterium M269]
MVHRKMGDDAIYRYSPQLKTIFKELSLVHSIKELQASDMLNLMKGYGDISSEELKLCTQYLLRQKPESQPEIVRLESNDYRREDRFKIETSISILVEDKKVVGSTIDVSARGLAINLEVSDLNLKQGSEIQVTFEELNESESDFNLSNLKYKVIFSKERLLRLEVLRDKGSIAVKFWSRYILNNISTLKIVGNEERFYGLKRALRNLVSQTYSSVPAFFTVKES